MVVECKNCGGKGHVMDGCAIFCLTIFSPILALVERNDADGITREKCLKCDGTGYVYIDENKLRRKR